MKINIVTNWFKLGRTKKGKVVPTTFRKVKRDIFLTIAQLERTVGSEMSPKQFDAQRHRVELMLELTNHSEEILLELVKAGSSHNCFNVRWRVEKLKEFLTKYSILLNTYNSKFLTKIHSAIHLDISNGLIVGDNLIYKGENEVEIIR